MGDMRYLEDGEANAWRLRQIARIERNAGRYDRALQLIHNVIALTDEQVEQHILNGTHAYRVEDIP